MPHHHLSRAALLALCAAISPAAHGQHPGGGGGIGTGSRSNPTTSNPSPSYTPSSLGDLGTRGIYLSGKVQMEDGSAPPEPVLLERRCGAAYRKAEGYTDSKGRFSFQLGEEQGVLADASFDTVNSNSGASSSTAGNAGTRANNGPGAPLKTTNPSSPGRSLAGCELTASLAGFRSDAVNLDQHRKLDNPDVGVLILRRLANVEGSSISVTTLRAPKDARKAFDKAREALRKGKSDEAEKQLQKAVELYPQFAEAWFQLGLLQQKGGLATQARSSYEQANAADPKLLSPYLPLARIAVHEKKWEEVADFTARLIKLDAVDFPEAYYYNAAANFRLKKLDDAESSARQSLKLDNAHLFPEAAHILGIILYQKNDYAAAAAQLRDYLQMAPQAPDAAQVKSQLAELERMASTSPAGSAGAPQQ